MRTGRTLLIAPALAAAAALTLAACGSDAGSDAAEDTSTSSSVAAAESSTAAEQDGADGDPDPGPEVFDAPVALLSDGAIRVGETEVATRIDVFVDYMCPHCAQFHQEYGEEIDEAIDAGELVVDYRYLDFLNRSSTDGEYSTRAAGAARCVAADDDAAALTGLSDLLFTAGTQPQGGTLTDDELADYAREAGASDEAVACIADGDQTAEAAEAAQANERVLQDAIGRVGTPVVLYQGEDVDISKKEWLRDLED